MKLNIFTNHPIVYDHYATLLRDHANLRDVSAKGLGVTGVFDYEPGELEAEILMARIKLPELRPLILLKQSSEDEGLRWLMRGVWGIVLYDRHREELARALCHIAGGQLWYPASVIQRRMRVAGSGDLVGQAICWTSREREALELLAAGHSNRDIAKKLKITPRTAQFHVSNILSKLGFDSRQQLMTRNRD